MDTNTVLVVDDSKSARFAMRKFLEGFGFQVATAESAEDAYSYLSNKLPDVMFIDHVMPGTDGFAAIKEIKRNERTAGLPIILCSSTEGEDFRREARACGAVDVLQKPPTKDQLRTVLDSLKQRREPAPQPERPVHQEAAPAAEPAPKPAAAHEIAALQEALREEMEERLGKITQDLFREMAEAKGQLAHLGAAIRAGRDEEPLRVRMLKEVDLRLDVLTRSMEGQLAQLRSDIEAMLSAQNLRIDQFGEAMRQAVLDEARIVSEQVAIGSAQRIWDQVAESLQRALKPIEAAGAGFSAQSTN
jgi:CheY-like chemotaxis protein